MNCFVVDDFVKCYEAIVCFDLNQFCGALFVKILYLTDLSQKLLSLRIFSYLCEEKTISALI